MKHLFLRLLSALVLFASVVSPASALLPNIAVLGLAKLVSISGATYSLGALAGMIGMTGLYLEISDSEGNQARIPTSPIPAAEPPVPAAPPSAIPTDGLLWNGKATASEACDLVAPSSTSYGCGSSRSVNVFAADKAQCLIYYSSNPNCPGGVCACGNTTIFASPSKICPVGYIASGQSCSLVPDKARLVSKDKKCDILIKNGGYGYAADADCPTGPTTDHTKAVPVIRNDGGKVIVYGKDSYGQDVAIETSYDTASQSTKVSQSSQQGTNVKVETLTFDKDGKITGTNVQLSPGQISAPQSSPTSPSTPANPSTTPTVSTDPTKAPNFPDDYARERTAQRTAQSLDDLLKPSAPPADPLAPELSRFDDAFFKDTFKQILDFRLPSHASECPKPVFDFSLFGSRYHLVMDAHCIISEQIRAVLSNAMVLFWTLAALFIIFGA